MNHKKLTRSPCFAFVLALLLGMVFASPVLAAGKGAVIDPERTCELVIDYKEDVEGVQPVVGAGFTVYKVAGLTPSGGYQMLFTGLDPVTDKTDPEQILPAVKKAYRSKPEAGALYQAVTDQAGQAVIRQMEQGLYLIEESTPAKEHFAGKPFFCSLPKVEQNAWVYSETAAPKAVPAGKLTVSKTVRSHKADKNTEFHFIVTFAQYEKPVHYTKSDHTEGMLKSGGILSLKHTESAVFDMLPVGISYEVTEQEADQNGYLMTSKGASGTIRREGSTAAFTNTQVPPKTGDRHYLLFSAIIATLSLLLSVFLKWQLRKQ